MDLQFYGGNCVSLSYKGARIVVDDNLADLGAKSIVKPDDIALFTGVHGGVNTRLTFNSPGEYEVSDISIIGISAQAHIDEKGQFNATMFKIVVGDQSVLFIGHIYPELDDKQLETVGVVDVMVVPVGGNGYTVDPVGALKLIKEIEPKIVIPTHYADKTLTYPVTQQELSNALTEMAMEPKESVARLRLKPAELTDVTQLIIIEKT